MAYIIWRSPYRQVGDEGAGGAVCHGPHVRRRRAQIKPAVCPEKDRVHPSRPGNLHRAAQHSAHGWGRLHLRYHLSETLGAHLEEQSTG